MVLGYRAVLAVGEFRAVLLAHALSMLGTVVCELALSVLVYRLTGSPLLSALTFALGLLPYVAGGTVLSAVADRFPARRVLVVCDLVCACCAVGLALPGVPVAGLLVLRCLLAVIAPVFVGTRAATLSDVLDGPERFVLGNSALRVTSQGAQLGGFGAGGLLLTVVEPRAVLGLTVGTFLASAVLLGLGTRARPARDSTVAIASLTGIRQLFADRRIRALLLYAWVPPLFVVVSEVLLTPYVAAVGEGPAALGILMCGMPIGAIGGSLLAGNLLSHRSRVRLSRPVVVLATLPGLGYLAQPSVGWALLCQIGIGCGIVYRFGLDDWFLAAVPEELRGRAMTLLTAGMMTTQGLGMALAGLAAEFFPVHLVIAGGGAVALLCVSGVVSQLGRPR
ncbi:MFS transporter [Cryptosporangium aurantiacum]|uniref:Major Facilitator Superfamily protein n=1 Tax=Cryptosporangium aurantiacum TaxID=134849 RepID=A0A1M7RM31_9ACTN|nr:MFS transporter [Cryptosporangium aurantiacum]SHN47241.1 Major Facilitator Superfamily protein [Cryptosporangium aurantiacum]